MEKPEVVSTARSLLESESVRIRVGKDMGIPKRFLSAHISQYDWENIPTKLSKDGIFITGPPGVGKSHLAAAFLFHYMPIFTNDGQKVHPEQCSWISVPMLIAELRESVRNREKSSVFEIITSIIQQKLVVLDDFGAENASEFSSEDMYLIVAGRLDTERPTIVTSNQKLKKMNESGNARLASRFAAMDYYSMTGKDRRVCKKEA